MSSYQNRSIKSKLSLQSPSFSSTFQPRTISHSHKAMSHSIAKINNFYCNYKKIKTIFISLPTTNAISKSNNIVIIIRDAGTGTSIRHTTRYHTEVASKKKNIAEASAVAREPISKISFHRTYIHDVHALLHGGLQCCTHSRIKFLRVFCGNGGMAHHVHVPTHRQGFGASSPRYSLVLLRSKSILHIFTAQNTNSLTFVPLLQLAMHRSTFQEMKMPHPYVVYRHRMESQPLRMPKTAVNTFYM